MADRGDFDAFVTSRYAALARTAMLLTGARASGEDLLQEALIRTYVAGPKVRELAAGEAYVRTTMVRLLIRDREFQIAEALDCAPGIVKSRISRGLAALRAGGLALGDPVTDDTTAITTTAEARP